MDVEFVNHKSLAGFTINDDLENRIHCEFVFYYFFPCKWAVVYSLLSSIY